MYYQKEVLILLLEFKKATLMNKINSEQGLEECMIIGKASKNVVPEAAEMDLAPILEKFNIPYETKRLGQLTVSAALVYEENLLIVAVEGPTEEQVSLIMEHLFDDIQELYEVIIPLPALRTIFGWNKDYYIPLVDAMFRMLPVSQAELARQTGRSKQLFSEIKAKRMKPTLELMSQIMNLYPLLPWDYLIMSDSNGINQD